jgi:tol-pal system protein YbgF
LSVAPTTRVPAVRRAGPAAAAPRRAAWGVCAHRFVPALALIAVLGAAGPARAQLFADDDARKAILDLRTRFAQAEEQARARQAETTEQLQTLRRGLLEMNNQLEAMRSEVAKLRGENEQLQREVAELQKRQRDLGQAVDDRLRRIEPQKVTVDGREFSAQTDETRQFDEAMALLRAAEFGKAVFAFDAFQKRWPASGYGDAARFWRGNALYGQREYAQAIAAFRDYIARAPDSPRAPEAALAIANSQIETKDVKAARRTLEDLVKAYPKSEAAAAARERLTTLK